MAIIQFKDIPDLFRILDSKELKEITSLRALNNSKKRFRSIKLLEYNFIVAQRDSLIVFCKRTKLIAESKGNIKLLKI